MYPQFPGIAKGLNLLRLAGQVFFLAVLHIPFARAHLPVRAKLDAVGRVHVNHLHLALQALLFRQAGHHQQAVAQNHAVGPVLLVMVKIHQVFKGNVVKIRKQRHLLLCPSPAGRGPAEGLGAHILDNRLRADLLLNVNRHRRHFQRLLILLILALPNQLRVKRGVARVQDGLWRLLFVSHKVAQFLGGDVGAFVGVVGGGNGGGRGGGWFFRHSFSSLHNGV
uniref:hypothetical protein n=1 Tax=Levilinea saccharolytica TaxID=229921 RepID=UPI001F1C92E7|nr:hypothetical protein [Levilinea saccharolytica]